MGFIGQTKFLGRLLTAALQPLTGGRASATATVKANGAADVKLPANCHAYPVPTSDSGVEDVDDQRLLRSAAEVIVPGGSSAGIVVPVTSVLGGQRFNALKAGTRLLWDPPVEGLETHSVLATDMSGGTDRDASFAYPGSVQSITSFEEITGADLAQELFNARLQARIPAIVISWEFSGEPQKKGRGANFRADRWSIFAVVDSQVSEPTRRGEGLAIIDAIEALLGDKGVVDGVPYSSPPGTVVGRRRIATSGSSLVYVVQYETTSAAKRIDLRVDDQPGMAAEEGFADWDSTRLTLPTGDPPFPVVENAVYPQPQRGFDDGFDDGFG